MARGQQKKTERSRNLRDQAPKRPKRVDGYVGVKIRERRKELGLSQTAIGEKVGVSFQQVQKYENGTNRVGASRLATLAKALEVPVAYFFPEDDSKTNVAMRIAYLERELARLHKLL